MALSPWTKPGTKAVVVIASNGALPHLHKGLVVTVDKLTEADLDGDPTFGQIGVRIVGINHNRLYPNPYRRWWQYWKPKLVTFHYDRAHFDALDEESKPEAVKTETRLPETLTRHLADPTAPIKEDA